VVIFLVLAAQYESFRDPFIILVALPTSIFGALIPLNAGLATINIYTQIGLVTLIGLISKHGILMVDFANKLQADEGVSRRQAIEEAAAIRLRPILMTTAAMVVAMVPLLIAKGAGAASRFDIGVVIAAGMTIGTLFTLFVTPAIYTFLAKDYQKVRARTAEDAPLAAPETIPAPAMAGAHATFVGDGPREDGRSAEVLAFDWAAPAASSWRDKGRRTGRKVPRRKPLTPAAE
ncbi:MAG TPA: efflux RND transporter permease subunit, partial [Methyloceanibacter sp.]|nr:efflux RND transporter permease subunit [Methyloceanibacter sp.]